MKRVFLALSFLLIILPSSFALIEINEITPKVYNLGDKIKIAASITRETSFDGLLKINMACKEETPVISRVLDLSATEKYNFLEEITIPNIGTGECKLRVFLDENGNLIEEKNSDIFQVTKELNGNFVLVNSRVQLGSDVDIKGDISKVNGKKIDGIATTHFKKDKNVLFVDTEDVKEGSFTFNIPSNYTNAGSYSVDFNVRDASGNEKLFTEAIVFDITNLLNVDLKLNKNQVKPGELFEVTGVVTDTYGNRVNPGSFTVKFNDKELKGKILLGDIYLEIAADNNLKSGFHNILVNVMDDFGNKGSGTLNVEILSKAERAELKIDKDSYKPGENVKVTAFVYDQGRDLFDKDIEIEIRDSSGVKRADEIIKREFTFALPLISKPGEWAIKATSGALKDEKKFYVTEVKEISYKIEGQMLIVTNIGNVAYDDILDLDLDGVSETASFNEKIYLEPGESESIDLGKDVNTGIYKATINNKLFDNVRIEGRKFGDYGKNLNLIFVFIVLLVLGILLYMKKGIKLPSLGKFFKKERKEFSYIDDVKKVLHEKMEQKERFVKKEMQHLKTKENVFKEYITIKPRDEKLNDYRQKSSYLKRREKEKGGEFKEGMFNMFK